MVKDILKLGNDQLYEISLPVDENDLSEIKSWVKDLHDTLIDYRAKNGAGRAIAAPQIGIKKRLIYMLTDKEYVIINPELSFPDKEIYEVLDDCMSFPGLCVKVNRYKKVVLSYYDIEGNQNKLSLEGDYSELIQHEYDHLDGILATQRAVNDKSLFILNMKRSF